MESEIEHTKEDIHDLRMDIKDLVQFIKDHMKQEEKDRQILIAELQDIKTTQAKIAGYRNGIIAAISAFGLLAGLSYISLERPLRDKERCKATWRMPPDVLGC